jgi:RNA polymerase sigma factor (TIGR02999 family)
VVVRTEEIRRVLDAAAGGDAAADRNLFELLYQDLKELAHARRAGLAHNESLLTTDVVHESWLRLRGDGVVRWENRRHFFGAAANAMRNVLVDHARRRAALKRDASRQEELVDELVELGAEEPVIDVLSLHRSLEALEQAHPRPARVVTLRFFGGLAMPEIAEVLAVSLASVERDWRFGRAWLQRAMEDDAR